MLVLTRKKNQAIMLGENIKITVLEIGEDTVKIGINAPRDISILREELHQAVKEENAAAVTGDKAAVEMLKGFLKLK